MKHMKMLLFVFLCDVKNRCVCLSVCCMCFKIRIFSQIVQVTKRLLQQYLRHKDVQIKDSGSKLIRISPNISKLCNGNNSPTIRWLWIVQGVIPLFKPFAIAIDNS